MVDNAKALGAISCFMEVELLDSVSVYHFYPVCYEFVVKNFARIEPLRKVTAIIRCDEKV